MNTEQIKQDLVFTRQFDAPIEQVWNAWVEPELVRQWWSPDGFTVPLARMDFREGGTSLVSQRAPQELGGYDIYMLWTYTEIVPFERVEFILNFADQDSNKLDPAATGLPPGAPQGVRHLVAFKGLGDRKTEMTVIEYDWTVGPMMEMSRLGMEQCLDKLAALLDRS